MSSYTMAFCQKSRAVPKGGGGGKGGVRKGVLIEIDPKIQSPILF